MMTKEKEDSILRWLAIAGMVLIAIIVLIPGSFYEEVVARSHTNIVIRISSDIVACAVFLAIMPFFLMMFFECGFSRHMHKRWIWLTLFFLVPLLSAYIYFFVTRSARYKEYLSRTEAFTDTSS
jgi:cytochrome bd-type quinol oxidase subunit 2